MYVRSYLHKLPLPRLQDGCSLIFIPVDVMNLVVVFKVLIQLLRTHQQEHGLESLRAAKHPHTYCKLRTHQRCQVRPANIWFIVC